MKIALTQKNEGKITAALKKINGRKTGHIFPTGKELLAAAAMAEDALGALNLPRSKRAGASAIVTSGGRMPAAYKYRVSVNRVTMVRTSQTWTATKIEIDQVWDGGAQKITLLPMQEKVILAGIRSQYSVA